PPHPDTRIQQCVPQSEKQRDVLIERMPVALGYELCEAVTMTRWCFGRRAICPIFGDDFFPVIQISTEAHNRPRLLAIAAARIQCRPIRQERGTRIQRERNHETPVGSKKFLRGPVTVAQRLPPVRIAENFRVVYRRITRVVGVRTWMEVPELVRSVVMSIGKDGCGRHVPDSGRLLNIRGPVVRVEAQARHQWVEYIGLLRRKEIDEGAVSGIADGFVFVCEGALSRRTPKC